MTTEQGKTQKNNGYRHLTPLEVITIAEAVQRGEKVVTLSKQFGVCRQTIYNAVQTVKESRIQTSDKTQLPSISSKRKRTTRIAPETCQQLIELKRRYPSWGVEYLRNRWIQMGNPPIAKSTIYKLFKRTDLLPAKNQDSARYERFEMMSPGQLYQMDIEGEFYLTGIGWVYGFAVLDDFSRFVPAMTYFPDARLSNGILTLNAAILQYGIPDAIYVDNGSQFKSRGERMNNFELFCQAYGIKVINSTPYRPQGKGKIERFYETVENQFIAEIKQKIQENPGYSLHQLNQDLADYLANQYHSRIHGGTHEKPIDRFGQGTLRFPDPPIDVQQFLERTESRTVNKFREISYQGYKIQVDLLPRTKVVVVDMLETIRIEYQEQVIREINKTQLTKVEKIKHQNGAFQFNIPTNSNESAGSSENSENTPALIGRNTHKPDDQGYYHRKISGVGNFKINNRTYYIDQNRAGQEILVQITENVLRVYDLKKVLVGTMDNRMGKKYI
jgi:transposase InsO family protein